MKEILLGIAVSIQTLRGCIAQELKLPQYDTQPPTNELLKHARAYTWKAYYLEFKHNVFRFDPNMNKNTKKSFYKNFKRVTKTKTGKTLLCRILIEIRKRHDMNLDIKIGNMGFTQGEDDTQFALQFSTDRIKACVIDPKKYAKATDHLKDNLHIHLFHELCHWFHTLQDPGRKRKETEFRGEILDHPLSRYYFERAKPKWLDERGNITHEINLWRHNEYVGIEEIRTILGAHKDEYYQEGDDLCENLYRLEIGAPLRYGHLQYDCTLLRDSQYKADIRVINRIINTCNENYMSYQ